MGQITWLYKKCPYGFQVNSNLDKTLAYTTARLYSLLLYIKYWMDVKAAVSRQ